MKKRKNLLPKYFTIFSVIIRKNLLAVKYTTTIILTIVLCIASIFCACSVRQNTAATRAYHELTTRYNVYHNAQILYDQTLENAVNNHRDNFTTILPFYPPVAANGAFAQTIEKATKAIDEHSISARPRRDPYKRMSDEYRQWLRQAEFNPFMKYVWLLLGKAYVQDGQYEMAKEVLQRTTTMYASDSEIVAEAQIWLMRAYSETGWSSEATKLAEVLQVKPLKTELKRLFTETHAAHLISIAEYERAIPLLQQSASFQKNATQKRRLLYLLGQLYALQGKNKKAYEAFGRLQTASAPIEAVVISVTGQAQVEYPAKRRELTRRLEKMIEQPRNSEYIDRLSFALGNMYLDAGDTLRAIDNYTRSAKWRRNEGGYRALAWVALGDICFARADSTALEHYNAALAELPENSEHRWHASLRTNRIKGISNDVASASDSSFAFLRNRLRMVSNDTTTNERPHNFDLDADEYIYAIVLPKETAETERNRLLFNVADFNFTNYLLRTFKLEYTSLPSAYVLQVSPFATFNEAHQYAIAICADSTMLASVAARAIIISDNNFHKLYNSNDLAEYYDFYSERFSPIPPYIYIMKEQPADEKTAAAPKTENTLSLTPKVDNIAPKQLPTTTINPKSESKPKSIKQVEKERKQLLKERERERKRLLKEREKQRKALLKQRERERKEKLKQRR